MSGKKSVTKGKRYERRVAVALREVFPNAARCLQYQRAHGAPDVRAGPLWVEVKGRQVPAVRTWKAADKAMRDAGASDVAALVMPSGGTGPLLITLPLRDLIELIQGNGAKIEITNRDLPGTVNADVLKIGSGFRVVLSAGPAMKAGHHEASCKGPPGCAGCVPVLG